MTTDSTITHSPEELDDCALIALCQSGNEGAFDVLYSRYRLQLFSYLHKLLPEHSGMVDDFFQQTWVKAVNNFHRYSHQQRFLAWLCRIAHNLVMDYYRSGDSRLTEEVPDHTPAGTPAPDSIIIDSQLVDALEIAITKLPKQQQQIIRHRNNGLSFKEIASCENISLNTALGRMHYAIQNLRKLLRDYLP